MNVLVPKLFPFAERCKRKHDQIPFVEISSALADGTAARAALASCALGSDRIGILPAALHVAEAKEGEWSAQFQIGLTLTMQGGLNGGRTPIQPRGAAADLDDLAQA